MSTLESDDPGTLEPPAPIDKDSVVAVEERLECPPGGPPRLAVRDWGRMEPGRDGDWTAAEDVIERMEETLGARTGGSRLGVPFRRSSTS